MGNNQKTINVFFDEREKRGSIEHFWHFLFGYYLPLVEYLESSRFTKLRPDKTKLIIQNCGPVVNQILIETLSAMNIPYSWSDKLKFTGSHSAQGSTKKLFKRLLSLIPFVHKKNIDLLLPRWDINILKDHRFPRQSQKNIFTIRAKLPYMFPDLACCDVASANGKILLLNRAPEHPFYSKSDGNAEIRTYGAGRRTLEGVEACQKRLKDSGIDCMTYTPGSHNIFCQMSHFAKCAGVIGVRGSEFANLLWMKKDALAIMIHSEFFKNKNKIPPQRTLAFLMGLNYMELDSNAEVSPKLDADMILSILKDHAYKT